MKWAKQLIAVFSITMILLISTGLGEERQVYQLAEDCPVFLLPGDTENRQMLPKGKNVEVIAETAFGGEDWSLVLSQDGIYGYVRSDLLVTDEASMKTDIPSQETEKLKSLQVGNIVTFGRYEQDNNTANGPEGIEWMVLDVQDGKCLLLSRYGLDALPYNKEYVDTAWKTCTLRKWLNEEFLNNAFTGMEQMSILMSNLDNSAHGYNEWNTSGGDNTQDKVFLLSYAEANKYLGVKYQKKDNIESRAAPTAYAIQQGAFTSGKSKTKNDTAAGIWWLRSPGRDQRSAAVVFADGALSSNFVSYGRGSVCPALWIDLKSADLESIALKADETENQVLLSVDDAVREERIAPFKKVGNIVTFGRYEQDTNIGNGPEEIEWIVLDVQDGKSLLLSKYGLDEKMYNEGRAEKVTWVSCSLRKWLNESFIDTAFSETEKTAILKTVIDNGESQKYEGYDTRGGMDTVDQIFLLSYHEAFNLYFHNDKARICSPTTYAISQGAWISGTYKTDEGKRAGTWWLRSPGSAANYATYIIGYGSFGSFYVNDDSHCVRPALWVDLESDIF